MRSCVALHTNSTPGERLAAIKARLTPAPEEEIAKRLLVLVAQFPAQRVNGVEADLRLEGYLTGLRSFPLEAIDHAFSEVMSGKTPYGKPYCPTSAELGDLCRRHQNRIGAEYERARAEVDGAKDRLSRRELTETEMQRRREYVDAATARFMGRTQPPAGKEA